LDENVLPDVRADARGHASRSHGGEQILGFRVSPIKGGALPLFPHFQLNSWGLKRCVYTSFFPDRIAGFFVGSPLQTGGGEVLLLCRIF
jgi:hypothetical protein